MNDMKFRFGLIKRSNEDPVPDDEPIFILRARDHLAVQALEYYYLISRKDGCTDYHLEGLRQQIALFRDFAEDHKDRMKQPGVTRGL